MSKVFRVFISHSQQDRPYVANLAAILQKEGNIHVWLDKEYLASGKSWDKALKKGLSESDLILVVSPSPSQPGTRENPNVFNPNVYLEAGMAVAMGKPVTFIVPEAELKSGRFHVDLKSKNVLIRRTPSATARELIQSEQIRPWVATARPSTLSHSSQRRSRRAR